MDWVVGSRGGFVATQRETSVVSGRASVSVKAKDLAAARVWALLGATWESWASLRGPKTQKRAFPKWGLTGRVVGTPSSDATNR